MTSQNIDLSSWDTLYIVKLLDGSELESDERNWHVICLE
jgi:hypothetical protein